MRNVWARVTLLIHHPGRENYIYPDLRKGKAALPERVYLEQFNAFGVQGT